MLYLSNQTSSEAEVQLDVETWRAVARALGARRLTLGLSRKITESLLTATNDKSHRILLTNEEIDEVRETLSLRSGA